jgi:tetratricopeptide (TPR) repeat protein
MPFRKKQEEDVSQPVEEEGAPDPNALALFQQGMQFCNNDQYDDAIQLFTRLLNEFPNFEPSLVHYSLGLAYEGKNDYASAEYELNQSIQANVQNFEAHIYLGSVLAKQGKFAEARAEYSFVLENNPKHELANGLRGTIQEWDDISSGQALANWRAEVEAFRYQAQQQFKVNLDYSLASLDILNTLIDAGWNDQGPGGDTVLGIAGMYLGEIIITNIGGEWSLAWPKENSKIKLSGQALNPFDVIKYKFKKGQAFSLGQYLSSLK